MNKTSRIYRGVWTVMTFLLLVLILLGVFEKGTMANPIINPANPMYHFVSPLSPIYQANMAARNASIINQKQHEEQKCNKQTEKNLSFACICLIFLILVLVLLIIVGGMFLLV